MRPSLGLTDCAALTPEARKDADVSASEPDN